MSELKILRYY